MEQSLCSGGLGFPAEAHFLYTESKINSLGTVADFCAILDLLI